MENEQEDIRRTIDAIRDFTGRAPRGWLGPGLTETWNTPDILAEQGYGYVCDWVLDDQPLWLQTRSRPLVSVPYTQECNDVAMMLIQHHKASEYLDRALPGAQARASGANPGRSAQANSAITGWWSEARVAPSTRTARSRGARSSVTNTKSQQ